MANGALQICGFVLATIGWVCAIITCTLPNWRQSDRQGEVIELVYRTSGLWSQCQHQSTGLWTCDAYDSFFLGLPASLQGARATTCLAIALGFIGMLVSVFGLECTTVGADNPRLKNRMVIASGVLHAIAGISIGISVSWFASNVLTEYNSLLSQNNTRYVYGEALFVGWISMALNIISGLLLCCSSWNSDEDDGGRPYTYNPHKPKTTNSAEYI